MAWDSQSCACIMRSCTSPADAVQFKRRCRALGIARWPARKLKSVRRAIDACANPSWLNVTSEAREQLSAWAGRLADSAVRFPMFAHCINDISPAQCESVETLGQGGALSIEARGVAKIIGWTAKQRHAARVQPGRVFRTVPCV